MYHLIKSILEKVNKNYNKVNKNYNSESILPTNNPPPVPTI